MIIRMDHQLLSEWASFLAGWVFPKVQCTSNPGFEGEPPVSGGRLLDVHSSIHSLTHLCGLQDHQGRGGKEGGQRREDTLDLCDLLALISFIVPASVRFLENLLEFSTLDLVGGYPASAL